MTGEMVDMSRSVRRRAAPGLGRNLPGAAAAVRQQARDEPGGCHPREVTEIACEVRLIVIAAVEGDVGQASKAAPAEAIGRAREPEHAAQCLRGQTDLVAEARDEVALAPADLTHDA